MTLFNTLQKQYQKEREEFQAKLTFSCPLAFMELKQKSVCVYRIWNI